MLGGLHCSQAEHLCICCRIFGWLKKGDVHSGRASISDAKPPRGTGWREEAYIERHALSEPKPKRHPLFYPQGGRKFYYHHNPDQLEPHVRITGIQEEKVTIAKANQRFSFKVDFADLNGPELGLLLYALQLEDDWYHKLGYGKPLGFGTVKIAVDNIEQRPSDYYENWDNRFLSLESILFIQARIEEFFQHQFHCSHRDANTLSHWRDLSHLLKRHDGYNIHYPSQQWFTNHPNETLPTPTEIEAGPEHWLPE